MTNDQQTSEKVIEDIIDCMNVDTKHAYAFKCEGSLIWHLEKAFKEVRQEAQKEVINSDEVKNLQDYLMHDECILSRWEAGEPTPDGGYRTKFAGKWYQAKPVDETPKCNCGLDKALTNFQRLKDKINGEGK